MADKPVVPSISSPGHYDATALNSRFNTLADEFENVLGRNGVDGADNTMAGNIDMDTKKIVNLGAPTASSDAARLQDITDASDLDSGLITLRTELASNANGEGASLIGVEDAAANFTATTVEAVLAEVFATSETKLSLAGGTVTGTIEMDDGTATSPILRFTDGVTGSYAWLDMSGEKFRIVTDYQLAAAPTTKLDIDPDTGVLRVDRNDVGLARVLDTGDEGSGNGLDADTVDGVHASSFLQSTSQQVSPVWINLDGSTATTPAGTTGIRDSIGVTSVERTAPGKFTVNLSVTMANANYVVATSSALTAAPTSAQFSNVAAINKTTTSFELWVADSNGAVFEDSVIIDAVVFGEVT